MAKETKVETSETKEEVKVEPVQPVEAPVEPTVEPTEKSEAYKALEETIEKYKLQNPKKYEVKKEALATQLSALK